MAKLTPVPAPAVMQPVDERQPIGVSQTNADFWIITGTLLFLTLTCATVSLVLCRRNIQNDTYL